jgi:DNA damage-binding protein 1
MATPMVTDVGPKGCIYNYHVTAHRPTAVTHCAVGNFTSSSDVNLIIG